ncbi:MAG: BON domain-containing protein [Ardenticatenia bacterium]|nr:BON domain-containing protein [Ardenticatenia bacterium]
MVNVEAVRQAVERTLLAYDPIRTGETAIHVDVSNGSIVLRGYVRTENMKFAAEELAGRVPGVHQVDNRLISDSALDVAVAEALEEADGGWLAPLPVQVRAIKGHVMLRGPVPCESAREEIRRIALQVPGVLDVHDYMDVNPAWIERVLAPKKRRKGRQAGAGGPRQAMVGGRPVTADDLPAWALKPKEAWTPDDFKARARAKMAFKRGEGPDPKEIEEAGRILRESATASAASEEEAAEDDVFGFDVAPAPAPSAQAQTPPTTPEEVPEDVLSQLKQEFPEWALKSKEAWAPEDFKAFAKAKSAFKKGQGPDPKDVLAQAQAKLQEALGAARRATAQASTEVVQDPRRAALMALRAQFPGWALKPRRLWTADDFREAAEAKVAELRGAGKPVREILQAAQEALEKVRRGEAVEGAGEAVVARRRELSAEEVQALVQRLAEQYPAWALKPKEAWAPEDFKAFAKARSAFKKGQGPDPNDVLAQAQAALEKAKEEALASAPAQESSASAGEIPPELLEKYPAWALKPKEAWAPEDFKAFAKAKSAFKKGEGPDPEEIIAEAQAALK